jgi:hypothetical protein
MQRAQIDPLNAAVFDKTILLITKLMTTLMMTRHDEPDYEKKYSAKAPIFRDVLTTLPTDAKCETFCSLVASMALGAEVVNAV